MTIWLLNAAECHNSVNPASNICNIFYCLLPITNSKIRFTPRINNRGLTFGSHILGLGACCLAGLLPWLLAACSADCWLGWLMVCWLGCVLSWMIDWFLSCWLGWLLAWLLAVLDDWWLTGLLFWLLLSWLIDYCLALLVACVLVVSHLFKQYCSSRSTRTPPRDWDRSYWRAR